MRACILIDAWEPIWGGGQVHTYEIARRICKKNWYIDIFTRSLVDDFGRVFGKSEVLNGKMRIFRVGPAGKFFSIFPRLLWLLVVMYSVFSEHKKNPYSIIHAHAYSAGVPGKILSILLRIPVIFTVHGSNNLDVNKNTLVTHMERIILTKIQYSHQISVTKHFLKYPNVNSVTVIPNGVTTESFDRFKNKRGKYFTMLWVGRVDPIKGLSILKDATQKFFSKYPKTRLILVGDKDTLKKIFSNEKTSRHYVLLGQQRGVDLMKVYKSADLFVLPSLSEGMPLTVLEAYAAKLPVLATNVGDIPHMIKNGSSGFLVTPNSVPALLGGMQKSYNLYTKKKLKSLGLKGYRTVKESYTWERAVDETIRLYESYTSL